MGLKDWFKKHTGEDLEDSLKDALTNPVGELVELLIKGLAGEFKQQARKGALKLKIPGLTPAMIDALLPWLINEVQVYVKKQLKVK